MATRIFIGTVEIFLTGFFDRNDRIDRIVSLGAPNPENPV